MAKIPAFGASGAALAALGLLLAGCSSGVAHHYVRSARVKLAAPATTPALNLSNGEPMTLAGFRVSQGGPSQGRSSTKTDTSAFNDTTLETRHGYFGYPGNYEVKRDPLVVGFDFQGMPNRIFDFFFTAEVAPQRDARGSMMVGMGLTWPARWIGLRAAPSLTALHYRMAAVDSIYTYEDLVGGGTVETEELVSEDRDRLGFGAGGSLSAWIPGSLTGIPFTPFVQYQYNAIWVNSSTLPSTVLALRAHTLGGGFDYETSFGHLQARLAREAIAGEGPGWSRSYRAQTALIFRLRE
jgi:hypothetical protein